MPLPQCGVPLGNREVEIAHASGLSFGKYRAYLGAGPRSFRYPEDVQGLTMRADTDKSRSGRLGQRPIRPGLGGQRNGTEPGMAAGNKVIVENKLLLLL